jgi:hypothetical protein
MINPRWLDAWQAKEKRALRSGLRFYYAFIYQIVSVFAVRFTQIRDKSYGGSLLYARQSKAPLKRPPASSMRPFPIKFRNDGGRPPVEKAFYFLLDDMK